MIHKLQQDGDARATSVPTRQKTFTAAFDGSWANEKPFAQEVINHTGIDGHFTSPNGKRLWQEVDRCLYFQDGFFFSTSVYAGWKVMSLAAQHVKVLLNGQGGDEIFCGYTHYEPTYLSETLRQFRLNAAREYLKGRARILGLDTHLLNLIKHALFTLIPASLKLKYLNKKMNLHIGSFPKQLGVHLSGNGFPYSGGKWPAGLNQHLWSDQTCSYLPMLLRYDDRNASAVSIENRVPFLDHRLVEYVNNIPAVYKVHNGWSKWLLRLAMRELLPESIIWRKDKKGFSTPQMKWVFHRDSPIPTLMQGFGIDGFNEYWWSFYVAHKMLTIKGVLDDLVA